MLSARPKGKIASTVDDGIVPFRDLNTAHGKLGSSILGSSDRMMGGWRYHGEYECEEDG